MLSLASGYAVAKPLVCRAGLRQRAAQRAAAAVSLREGHAVSVPLQNKPISVSLSVRASRRRSACVVLATSADKAIVPDSEKSITKVSFGTIGLAVGTTLLVSGFLGYFNFIPGSDNSLSSLLLIYGFPVTLIGFALKYAELKPLECVSYADAVALREAQATPILRQVRSDVTRFRYGDEQHLDEALDRIFRVGKAGGIRRNQCPVLMRLREEVIDGRYALVLGFDTPDLPLSEWESRQPKIQSFFGPGVTAVITPQGEGKLDVALISDGTAAGGVADDEEVLPPLMPGLAPRVVKKGQK